MPDSPTPLDWAKFSLDRNTAVANATSTLLKAYADYNYRIMEVLEKRVKIETNLLKLRIMNDAFTDFKRARTEVMRERRKVRSRLKSIERNAKNVRYLAQGDELDADLVNLAWIGIRYFLNNAPMDVAPALNSINVSGAHRAGNHFSHNRKRGEACADAPDSVDNIRSLINFLARNAYMPRFGSPPYMLIAELINVLNRAAEDEQEELNTRLATIKDELAEIRAADWKTIDIAREPKDASA